jgi:hypothetical protein
MPDRGKDYDMKQNKCPLIDYQKNYKAIAIDALAKLGICIIFVLFICWGFWMA